ncbi:phospholipase C [Malassezia cuniculi]|uniref:Phospholipase C n=1 Tax=Malassezia cuniculi TaxID=948313 RepID=A0AAF0J6H9_9BASI|nr:phospholipase C [Malassezia cuniculi]WFD37058.1 phospholipase C [Malassezia cuniculi]
MRLAALLALAAALAPPARAGLEQLDHIVLFMQENRAFDHYFGTMPGVRGFSDPNVHISPHTNRSVLYQPVDQSLAKVDGGGYNLDYKPPNNHTLLPFWYLNHAGADWNERSQCMLSGSNSWQANHAAWNNGSIDRWAQANTPYSIGYYRRHDIPLHFALAEEFTVADAYYESVIASTDPNRVSWFSGSINVNGSAAGGDPRMGGPVLDNNRVPACNSDAAGHPLSCRPLRWKTVPEYLRDANISWRVYQDFDNFGDNTLVEWKQYQQAARDHDLLAQRSVAFPGLDQFVDDATHGRLPAVSYIVGPTYLSEHTPYTPQDGAWLQRKIAHAVMHGKHWNSSALIVSYDETGGWADHVMAPHAPRGTPAEWIHDPFNASLGLQPTGPGFRLPFYILSPFTRRGGVFTEHASHESQILFLERWAAAKGSPFHAAEVNAWRRAHMSDLQRAFDFDHPDYSLPHLPSVPDAHKDPITGEYNGAFVCQERFHNDVQPPIPYSKNLTPTAHLEHGFKPVRGYLSEGRHLTFEAWDHALSHAHDSLTADKRAPRHDPAHHRFVLHHVGNAPNDPRFLLATPSRFVTDHLALSHARDHAAVFHISDRGNGRGHLLRHSSGKYLTLAQDGSVALVDHDYVTFSVFSVTY